MELTSFIQDISDVISKVSQIKYTYGTRSDISRIGELFRAPYGFSVNNTFEELKGKNGFRENGIYTFLNNIGCLWLDLIGYDFNTQKQDFYALFSVDEEHKKNREPYIYVYNYYLNSSNQYFIDVILQLCYNSNNIKIEGIDNIRDWGIELCVGNEDVSVLNESYKLSLDRFSSEKVINIVDKLLMKEVAGDDIIEKLESMLQIGYPDDNSFDKKYMNVKDYLDDFVKCRGTNNYIDKNLARTCIINKLLNVDARYIYFIPIFNPSYRQIGHMACAVSHRLDSFVLSALKILANSLLFPLSQTYLVTYFLNKVKAEAIKSAKAAIMSRNMSHNLGSHVMFYIKQKLNSVSKMLDSEVLKELYPDTIESLSKNLTEKEFEMPFLVGMGRFINYLQERQDYIATVATDYIPANSTISFKDFIYDELKPDLRYKRHKEKNSSSTETKGHKPKNLLMDFIAYSEGYESSDKIRLRFGEFTGENPEKVKNQTEEEKQEKDFKKLREFDVALPGGVIGRQAFFSIIENIIRNAAKHSGKRYDKKLAIDFNIIDISVNELVWDELLYDTTIYGGKRVNDLRQKYLSVKDKYFVLAITNNMPNSKEAIWNLEKALSCPYIDEEGNMDDKCKGIKEIRISAAWLRSYSIDTDIPASEPPVVAIRGVRLEGEKDKYAIQYYICLPKPKRVAFLVKKELNRSLNINLFVENKLKENSCGIFDCTDFEKQTDLVDFAELPDYDIIVCCDKDYGKVIPRLSSRVVKYQEVNLEHLKSIISAINEFKKGLESEDEKIKELDDEVKNCINKTYRLWYEQVYGCNNDKLTVMDNKSVDHKIEADKISVNLSGTSEDSEDSFKDAIIFVTHYEGMIQEMKKHQNDPENQSDRSSLFAQACFVEGITGNNSTDRLIRQNEWTEEWKYKHLAAGRTRIAIFDERIFSSISPLVERKRVSVIDILDSYLLETEEDEKSVYSLIYYFNESNDELNNRSLTDTDKIILQCQDAGIELLDTKNLTDAKRSDLIRILDENYNRNVHTTNYKLDRTQKYHEMKVWAFDVNCYEERTDEYGKIVQEAHVDIIGYNAPITSKIGAFDQTIYDVEVLATLKKTGMDYVLDLTKMRGSSFDFISIHQGILDKIYATFRVESIQATDKLTVKENQVIEKCKITHTLHRVLCMQKTPEEVTEYLPQFIIHSGRSKPNIVDMPQKQPFLQFAAIDHAIRDCKYTLSELLFSAHYEKGSNINS